MGSKEEDSMHSMYLNMDQAVALEVESVEE